MTNTDYYKPHTFTINQKQSDHLNERVHKDRKTTSKREFPNGHRSEVVRKLINEDIKNDK